METKNIIPVFISVVLVISVFSTISVESFSEGETDIVLARTSEWNELEYLESLGANVLHAYDSFTLIEIAPDAIPQIKGREITVDTMEDRTTLNVGFGRYEFDIKDGEPEISEELRVDGYGSGEKGQYLIHMLGPIAPEWRTQIEEKGVEVMNYVPNYAYRVRMTPEVADRVGGLDFVDWVGIYHPEYKIQPDLEPGEVKIRLVEGAERDSIDRVLNAESVTAISSMAPKDRGIEIKAEVESKEALHNLATITDVDYLSRIVESSLHGEVSSQITGGGNWQWDPNDDPYNPWRGYNNEFDYGAHINHLGYTGYGIVIAVADTGAYEHPDFQDRIIGGYYWQGNTWEDGHGHGTQTAGVAAGNTYAGTGHTADSSDAIENLGPFYTAQGLAYDSELFIEKVFADDGSPIFPSDRFELFEVAKQEADAYIHSNSWGNLANYNEYTGDSNIFDRATRDSNRNSAHNEPMVIVAAAGNEGETGVTPPATAKNIIALAASENFFPENIGNHYADNPENIADFSSRGFASDNRVKPDVTAPGQGVLSTGHEGDDSYFVSSGTSFSTPVVSGAAGVFVEWYEDNYGVRPSPALVKGLLINTAVPSDVDTGNTGHIPNGDEGWGRVDISKLGLPEDDPTNFEFLDQENLLETGDVDEHTVVAQDQNEPLRITLTWTDKEAPGNTGTGTALINDLNLEVISPSGDVYRGNAFAGDAGEESTSDYTYPNINTMSLFDDNGDGWDDTNNVLNVYIHPDEVESGAYTIKIHGFNIPEDGTQDGDQNQDYALTVYNVADDPQIEIERPLGGEYWEVGQEEEIKWSTFEGAGNITSVDIEYSVDGGSTWDHIVDGYSDTGSYMWTVPDQLTDQAVIRATVHDDINETDPGIDVSDEFTITDITPPEVILTSPAGGEEWNAGDEEHITWDSTQGDEPIVGVDLEYSTDGGNTWNPIVQGIDDTGEYTWEIPDETSSESRVRVWVNCQGGTSGDDLSDHFDLVGYPPEPPTNLDVEWWNSEYEDIFYDDVSEDKGYQTWDSDTTASTWDIRTHGSAVGDNSWDWGDGGWERGIVGESRLISPEIEIPDELGAELTFQHWRDLYPSTSLHGANVRISTDGPNGTFELIEPEGGYPYIINDEDDNPLGGEPGWTGREMSWETVTFDLSEYVGQSVHIRWNVGTCDSVTNGDGWRIDDITVNLNYQGTDHNMISWDSSEGDVSGTMNSDEDIIDEVKPLDHYNLYRSENPDGPWDETTHICQVEADGSASYSYVDEGKGELDDTYWWYVVRAVSEDGVEEENEDAVQEPGAQTSLFDISLTTDTQADDWNFVSFNLVPANSDLTAILDDADYGISGNYDKVMYYDASTDEWQSYIPGRAEHFNGLTGWDHTMGVWIRMNADDTLTVEGTEPTSTDITLNPGWNMVGLPSESTGNHGLPAEVDKVGYFDSSAEYNIAYDSDPGTFVFQPGEGYWVHNPTDNAVIWTVNY